MATNVKVIARFRPLNRREKTEKASVVASVGNEAKGIRIGLPTGAKGRPQEFVFDHVFGADSSQDHVFKHTAAPLVTDVMSGYNTTIFAYGQTGSGKTFTMMGDLSKPNDRAIPKPAVSKEDFEEDEEDEEESQLYGPHRGIIPRLVEAIFQEIEDADINLEFTVKISYVEIYNERIKDLLDPSKVNLRIRSGGKQGTVWIQDVTETYVGSVDQVIEVMDEGLGNRATDSTNMNAVSSRSHAVFVLTLGQKDKRTGSKKGSKLTLVDLAGSEKVGKTGATGSTLDEAKHINKSLSALGNVINALTSGSEHIPYRNSKLTRLLSDSLGGNSKTLLIVTASLASTNREETISTLRFGTRAKSIKNKPKINQEKSVAEYKRLLRQAYSKCKQQSIVIGQLYADYLALKTHMQSNDAEGWASLQADLSDLSESLVSMTMDMPKGYEEKAGSTAQTTGGTTPAATVPTSPSLSQGTDVFGSSEPSVQEAKISLPSLDDLVQSQEADTPVESEETSAEHKSEVETDGEAITQDSEDGVGPLGQSPEGNVSRSTRSRTQSTIARKHDNLAQQHVQLLAEHERLQQEMSVVAEEKAEIEDQLSDVRRSLEEAQSEAAQSKEQVSSLQEQLASAFQNLQSLMAEKATNSELLDEQNASIRLLEKKVSIMKSEGSVREEEVNNEKEEMARQHKLLERQVRRLTSKLEQRDLELAEALNAQPSVTVSSGDDKTAGGEIKKATSTGAAPTSDTTPGTSASTTTTAPSNKPPPPSKKPPRVEAVAGRVGDESSPLSLYSPYSQRRRNSVRPAAPSGKKGPSGEPSAEQEEDELLTEGAELEHKCNMLIFALQKKCDAYMTLQITNQGLKEQNSILEQERDKLLEKCRTYLSQQATFRRAERDFKKRINGYDKLCKMLLESRKRAGGKASSAGSRIVIPIAGGQHRRNSKKEGKFAPRGSMVKVRKKSRRMSALPLSGVPGNGNSKAKRPVNIAQPSEGAGMDRFF